MNTIFFENQESAEIEIQGVERESNFFSRLGVKHKQTSCPYCGSVVYSRRQSLCGVCEGILPSALLFNENEANRVQTLLEEEKQKHRSWLKRSAAVWQGAGR